MTDDAPRAAGWYADPDNPFQHRWWDGSAWTDETEPLAGLAAGDDRPRAETPALAKPARPFWSSWWFKVIIIVVVTGIIVLIKRGIL